MLRISNPGESQLNQQIINYSFNNQINHLQNFGENGLC